MEVLCPCSGTQQLLVSDMKTDDWGILNIPCAAFGWSHRNSPPLGINGIIWLPLIPPSKIPLSSCGLSKSLFKAGLHVYSGLGKRLGSNLLSSVWPIRMIADDVCPVKWIVGVLFMSVQDGGLPDSSVFSKRTPKKHCVLSSYSASGCTGWQWVKYDLSDLNAPCKAAVRHIQAIYYLQQHNVP